MAAAVRVAADELLAAAPAAGGALALAGGLRGAGPLAGGGRGLHGREDNRAPPGRARGRAPAARGRIRAVPTGPASNPKGAHQPPAAPGSHERQAMGWLAMNAAGAAAAAAGGGPPSPWGAACLKLMGARTAEAEAAAEHFRTGGRRGSLPAGWKWSPAEADVFLSAVPGGEGPGEFLAAVSAEIAGERERPGTARPDLGEWLSRVAAAARAREAAAGGGSR